MFTKRKSFNGKRAIAACPVEADLKRWGKSVRYGGNPEHKRNAGDFGLIPPASPRRDKTLCDKANIFQRKLALELLKRGIKRGLVSNQVRNGFPQNVWAVSDDGTPFEAQLENPGNGTYHGYPMPVDDTFRELVLEKWKDCDA